MSKWIPACISVILFLAAAIYLSPEAQTQSNGEREKSAARGKQLMIEGNCNYCHTPNLVTTEGTLPDPRRTLSGHPADADTPELPEVEIGSDGWLEFLGTLDNTVWAGPWGLSFSTNLTPDPGTGIGKWTEKIFIETIRSGRHVSLRRDILPPMPWQDYGGLSDRDLKAIFTYLMTLEPVVNPVPKPIPFPKGKSQDY